MDSSSILLDDQHWPMVLVRPLKPVSDEELDAFLLQFRNMVTTRRQRYALVLDLRFSRDMPPTQRRRIGSEIQDGKANSLCAATAMVFTSRVMQLILTGIFWFARPEQPTKVFSDFDHADAWARAQIDTDTRRTG